MITDDNWYFGNLQCKTCTTIDFEQIGFTTAHGYFHGFLARLYGFSPYDRHQPTPFAAASGRFAVMMAMDEQRRRSAKDWPEGRDPPPWERKICGDVWRLLDVISQ